MVQRSSRVVSLARPSLFLREGLVSETSSRALFNMHVHYKRFVLPPHINVLELAETAHRVEQWQPGPCFDLKIQAQSLHSITRKIGQPITWAVFTVLSGAGAEVSAEKLQAYHLAALLRHVRQNIPSPTRNPTGAPNLSRTFATFLQ